MIKGYRASDKIKLIKSTKSIIFINKHFINYIRLDTIIWKIYYYPH